jgi:F0F1-type ATP synthase delta subunit
MLFSQEITKNMENIFSKQVLDFVQLSKSIWSTIKVKKNSKITRANCSSKLNPAKFISHPLRHRLFNY